MLTQCNNKTKTDFLGNPAFFFQSDCHGFGGFTAFQHRNYPRRASRQPFPPFLEFLWSEIHSTPHHPILYDTNDAEQSTGGSQRPEQPVVHQKSRDNKTSTAEKE